MFQVQRFELETEVSVWTVYIITLSCERIHTGLGGNLHVKLSKRLVLIQKFTTFNNKQTEATTSIDVQIEQINTISCLPLSTLTNQ